MKRTTTGLLILASAGVAAGVAMAVVVWSAKAQTTPGCPEDLCACLGAAAKYGVVANNFYGGPGALREDPRYTERRNFFVDDSSVCANKARVRSRLYGDAIVGQDLVLLAPKGIAARFSSRGYDSYGSYVGGDLVTAGGKLKGLATVIVDGTVDTTGTSSKLPDCRQAISDIAAASMTLRGLPATQTLPAIDLSGGATVDINAGPGVNVIRVPSIQLRQPRRVEGYLNYSEINIHLDPATDSVIINVDGSLDVGSYSNILVDGDISKVIINMSGAEGAKASLGTESYIDPTILIPTGTVTGFFHAHLGHVFAKRVVLRGAGITDELTCQ